ncbi:hypothetical protein TNCT_607841 [Trichonephila clavata]|uniref:Uncharacterized protein n=1 Tax=Trichonephila clavata TaxID=2740835 RepID=A0A8X6IMQ6_TRICU|nr:hypothetical protein TNCT_607841 [Trichonephila clavata]
MPFVSIVRNVGDRVKGSQEDRIRPGHIELCLSGKIPVGRSSPGVGTAKGVYRRLGGRESEALLGKAS